MTPQTCPFCDRILLRTIGSACSWCGKELPAHLRLSKEELQAVEDREEAQRAKEKALDALAEGTRKGSNRWIMSGLSWFRFFRFR